MGPEPGSLDLEYLDPTPDVHSLFAYYNALYFENQLGACSVEWSTKRMKLCAGVCHFSRTGGCRIKLSEPLLKFRPVLDLKETLLHEMIHAALFLGNVRDDGDHGPKFRAIMHRINTATCPDSQRPPGGYNITVYHTMHDEVNSYRTHVWRCTACGNVVRRSMNRPPQEADCRSYSKAAAAAAPGGAYCHDARCWYHGHIRTCGGVYEKIAEPEKPAAAKPAPTASSSKPANAPNKRRQAVGAAPITNFFRRSADPQQQQQHQGAEQPAQPQQEQGEATASGNTAAPAAAPKPSDPRHAAAVAALARAAGKPAAAFEGQLGASSVQQQQPASRVQEPGSSHHSQQQQHLQARIHPVSQSSLHDVVDLLSSEEGEEVLDQPGANIAGPSSSWKGVSPGVGSTAGVGAAGAAAAGMPQQALMCPVCCLEFVELGALNSHLDQCLL